MIWDDLTKLYNRRELFARLKQETARSKRNRIPFSIIMIDVDYFKEVNDNYGHLRGDRVLCELADLLRNNCREMDTPCRYGGDEFIIITPETDRWSVEKAGLRFLEKIETHCFKGDSEQPDLHLTVSIGTATYEINDMSAENLIARADQALYQAKSQGKNQVCKDIDVQDKAKEPVLNLTSFVDRADELAVLKNQFNSALAYNGRFLIVSGEAGIGKTRLVNELKTFGQMHKACFLSARPFEFGVTPPYHIFFQIIKDYMNNGGSGNSGLLSRLQPVYRAELVKYMPELRVALGVSQEPSRLSPEHEKMRLFDMMHRVISTIADESPVLIFFDDMQWSREADFELLTYFIRSIGRAKIFVCCAYRVEEIHDKHPLIKFLRAISREHQFDKIDLKGLSSADSTRLLNTILGFSVSKTIGDKIYHETNGNPYYIEEIIKSFVEEGVIFWGEDGWTFKDIQTVVLPSSVGDLLQRRLEGVEAEVKEVLSFAAAIGSQFPLVLLQEITGKNEGYLLDLLDEGIKQLLVREEPDDVFSFTNVLLQRTLYDSLSTLRKRRIHRAIARSIEHIYSSSISDEYESLAHHNLMAENWDAAFEYNLKAALKLKALYANQDAILRYNTCLDLLQKRKTSKPGARCEIFKGLGDIYYLLGEYDKAIGFYRRLLARDDITGKPRSEVLLSLGNVCQRMADFNSALSCFDEGKSLLDPDENKIEIAKLNTASVWIHIKRGEFDEAIEKAQHALNIFAAAKCDEDVASINNTMGTLYYERGEWDKAEEYYRRALHFRESINDIHGIATCMNNLGNIYHRRSECHQAIEYHTKALEMRTKIGDRFGIAASYNNVAVVYDDLGDWDKCLEYHHKSIEISKSILSARSVALSYGNIGFVLLKRDQFEESIDYSTRALVIAQRIGDQNHIASVKNNLANAMLGLGQYEEASQLLKDALEIIRECDYKNLYVENQRLMAEVHLHLADYDKAFECAKEALGVAKIITSKEDEAEIYMIYGRLYEAQEKLDEAIKAFDQCHEMAEAIQNEYICAKCAFFRGSALKKQGDHDAAQDILQKAKLIFTKLDCKRFLERVKTALQ